jgi:hypothetical protein
MNYQVEHLAPPQSDEVLNFITNGDPNAIPPIKPLQYGQVISPTSLNALNITSVDPASIINPFLSDLSADLNNPDKNGDYNCLLYHNTLGLVDDYSKDPLICANNIQSKCTLTAFSDANVLGVTDNNKKTYIDYNGFIGPTGLQLQKQFVSCGDKVNKLMWIYKDASSSSTSPDAIGIPVEQCGTIELNTKDLSTSTSTINELCKLPQSYALVMDTVTNAGYKCKQLPSPNGAPNVTGATGIPTPLSLAINPNTGLSILKCNNL